MTYATWLHSGWALIGCAGNMLALLLLARYWFWEYVMIPANWIEPWSRMH